MSEWQNIDRDDVPGYLTDYVVSWLKDHNIDSMERHYESYQMDSYRDDIETLVDNVIEAILVDRDE